MKQRVARTKKPFGSIEGEGCRKKGLVMGIDAHKSILACCIVNQEGIIFEKNYNNTIESISQIVTLSIKKGVESIGVEATSTYHLKIVFAFLDEGIEVILANPIQLKSTQGKKTDKLDARRIAFALRDGRIFPSVISPIKFYNLRKCTRSLIKTRNQETKCKQRIQQTFHLYEISFKSIVKDMFKCKWLLDLLIACLKIDEQNYNKMISELVDEYYPNTPKKRAQKSKINQLIVELRSLNKKLMFNTRIILLVEIYNLQSQQMIIKQYQTLYRSFINEDKIIQRQMDILMSIPGIGEDTAIELIAEMVDIDLFSSPEKLVKWVGLAPQVKQSGHRKKITGKVFKGGNKHARRAITLACTNIYAKKYDDHPIHIYMHKLESKHKLYWVCMCAGARKLLRIVHLLLKENYNWNPPSMKDPETLTTMKNKIATKLKFYHKRVEKYRKMQLELGELTQKLLDSPILYHNIPKKLIKIYSEVT